MEEKDIPIDINAGKLLDWLINRRHCNRGWQSNLLLIREKINAAIQDMPVHEGIAKLLSGTHINYFHCKKIIEILKETEANSKNIFGGYGSRRMKDWQEIVSLYEKNNIYLAEAAQMLIRNINYEVPGIKKQIQKLEQNRNELEKKEVEFKKSENTSRTEFASQCKQLGIVGKNIKRELVEKVTELPDIYEGVAKKTKFLTKVVEFYSNFQNYNLSQQEDGRCVPMIRYVIEKGNTSTYEWTYGEKPSTVEEPVLNVHLNESAEESNEIDFGDGEINFDLDDNAQEIDFNITLDESGIEVESTDPETSKATGNLALTVLDNPDTRNDFINQLLELEAFLKLRLYELKNSGENYSLNMQEVSPSLHFSNESDVQSMLDNVHVVLSEMMNSRVEHLHHIKHSPKYVDILAAALQQKLTLISKMETLQQNVKASQVKIAEEIVNLRAILTLLIQRTKELQVEIEEEISKKYKGRIVKLTGGIRNL